MGYRDDFYAVWNIIGYTGALHDFPTVYFVSPDLGLGGHITQRHPDSNNVGRQEVFPLAGYEYGNKHHDGRYCFVESWPDGGFHASRNVLNEIDPEKPDMRTLSILAKAITNCPEEKYISEYFDEDYAVLEAAARAKGRATRAIRQANRMIARQQR